MPSSATARTRIAVAALLTLGAGSAGAAALERPVRTHHPAAAVFAVARDHRGFLWLGTDAGLCRFDGASWQWPTHDKVLRGRIDALAATRDGALWIAKHGGPLVRFRDGVAVPVDIPGARGRITALAEEPGSGALLIGTPGTLLRHAAGTTAVIGKLLVSSLNVHDKAVWVGARKGVWRWQEGRLTAVAERSPVLAVSRDEQGALWLGTARGLIRRDSDGTETRPVAALADLRIEALGRDDEGNLWVGTPVGGLIQVGPPTALSVLISGRHGTPFAIAGAAEGGVWILTVSGLLRVRDGQVASFPFDEELRNQDLRTLVERPDGSVLLGGLEQGLVTFHEGRFAVRREGADVPAGGVSALFTARSGALWLAPRDGGLGRTAGAGHEPVAGVAQICPGRIVAMAEDPAGGLWMTTLEGALCHMTAEGLRRMPAPNAGGKLISVAVDAEGQVWVGSATRGLGRWHGGRLTFVDRTRGLGTNNVTQILEDGLGNFWLGSGDGIVKVARAHVVAAAEGRAAWVHGRLLGPGDGLPDPTCMAEFFPGGTRARDGALWFPTLGGSASVVAPRRVLATRVPPVSIDEITHDGTPARPGGRWPVGAGNVRIAFAAPAFSAPERLRFRHRVRGDAEWHQAGAGRTATYERLPPGRYRFEVQAFADDTPTVEAAVFEFTLLAPFHRTLPFYALLLLAALLAALGIHRLRTLQLRTRFVATAQERARIAREIHDTLEQSLVGVKLQLDATGGDAGATARLARGRELLDEAMREVRASIWSLRVNADEGGDLGKALTAVVGRTLQGAELSLSITTKGEPFPLDPGAVHQLVRIAQEAVTNAVRHGSASRVDAQVEYADEGVRVEILDNGRGFDPGGAGGAGHFGLIGMQERAEKLGAKMLVESRPGQGTRIEVAVPTRWRRPVSRAR